MTVSYVTLYLPGSSQGIQVAEGSQLHLIYVSMGANSIPSAPGETVRQDPFPQYVDDDELTAALAAYTPGGGSGAVDSVNGQTGTVVLTSSDVGAVADTDPRLSDARAPTTHTHTASQVSDSTATGRAVLTAADAAAARTAIGAGTSSLAIGTTGTTAKAGNYTPPVADLPAGTLSYVDQNPDGTWPNRRTSRTDVKTIWTKVVAASADPASVTSPAVNGAYANDLLVGV